MNELRLFPTHEHAISAFKQIPPDVYRANHSRLTWEYPNGDMVRFGTPDPYKYAGLQLNSVIIDDLCDITVDTRARLLALVRVPRPTGDSDDG